MCKLFAKMCANKLPDAFTNVNRVTNSYIPTTYTLEWIDTLER